MGRFAYEIGDRVKRTWDNRTGSVEDREEAQIGRDSYEVRWDDGGKEWVPDTELGPA